jgi:hypothetical protein
MGKLGTIVVKTIENRDMCKKISLYGHEAKMFPRNIRSLFCFASMILSSLYVCMAIKYIIVLFVETPRKFITAKLSIRNPGSSSVLISAIVLY